MVTVITANKRGLGQFWPPMFPQTTVATSTAIAVLLPLLVASVQILLPTFKLVELLLLRVFTCKFLYDVGYRTSVQEKALRKLESYPLRPRLLYAPYSLVYLKVVVGR